MNTMIEKIRTIIRKTENYIMRHQYIAIGIPIIMLFVILITPTLIASRRGNYRIQF